MISRTARWMALLAVAFIAAAESARAQDWPQWRGPSGLGTTTAANLPPATGACALKVLWKTPIPGEGCSSPIVCGGRVFVTTAYAGSQPHAWDEAAFWAGAVLAFLVTALALAAIARMRSTASWGLAIWTAFVIALTVVVLAKPRWFWQFPDPWTGTTIAAAQMPWVESLHVRPMLVLALGSLVLILIGLKRAERADLLGLLSRSAMLASGIALGLIGWRPDWFFAASEPWLAWLATGGLGLFALAGSMSGLSAGARIRLILAGAGLAVAGWLFADTPHDEFDSPLALQLRIVYLVPGVLLLIASAWPAPSPPAPLPHGKGGITRLASLLLALLAAIVFIRANYLRPESGVVRAALCLDAASGELLWHKPIYVAAAEKRHSLNSQATPTPACDGQRVFVYFGSGLAALSVDGDLLWLVRDPDFAGHIRYGAGSSVVPAEDKIIIYRDSEFVGHGDHLDDNIENQTARRPSALIAFDKATGREVWNVTPPFAHDSYMTPLVWTREGEAEVVIATWKTLAGFRLQDGGLRWSHEYPMQQIVPSPAVNGDCLFVTGGNALPSPMFAVRAPKGKEPARTVWSNRVTGGGIVSPVCWNGLLFSISHVGVLTCRDADSGQIHWTERLGGRCLASLVAGDGKVYAVDQTGMLTVFAADTTGTMLASHAFGENCSATPALAAGAIFARTAGHVYRMGGGD